MSFYLVLLRWTNKENKNYEIYLLFPSVAYSCVSTSTIVWFVYTSTTLLPLFHISWNSSSLRFALTNMISLFPQQMFLLFCLVYVVFNFFLSNWLPRNSKYNCVQFNKPQRKGKQSFQNRKKTQTADWKANECERDKSNKNKYKKINQVLPCHKKLLQVPIENNQVFFELHI